MGERMQRFRGHAGVQEGHRVVQDTIKASTTRGGSPATHPTDFTSISPPYPPLLVRATLRPSTTRPTQQRTAYSTSRRAAENWGLGVAVISIASLFFFLATSRFSVIQAFLTFLSTAAPFRASALDMLDSRDLTEQLPRYIQLHPTSPLPTSALPPLQSFFDSASTSV